MKKIAVVLSMILTVSIVSACSINTPSKELTAKNIELTAKNADLNVQKEDFMTQIARLNLNNTDLQIQNSTYEAKIAELQEQNEAGTAKIALLTAQNTVLRSENNRLTEENNTLKSVANEVKKEQTVQSQDVVVKLAGVTPRLDKYDQPRLDQKYTIQNNTKKIVKGVQGECIFSDLFGVVILVVGCDFTGHLINPGQTYTNSDMSLDINQFVAEQNKLYNTDYADLKFEYIVKTIVFSDGSVKTGD